MSPKLRICPLQIKRKFLDQYVRKPIAVAYLFVAMSMQSGCSDGISSGSGLTSPIEVTVLTLDVTGEPIAGAAITLNAGGTTFAGTTGADGSFRFLNVPTGGLGIVTVSADGFESVSADAVLTRNTRLWQFYLNAVGQWAIGQPVVLESRVVEFSPDGDDLRIALDIAVISEDSRPIETLTAGDFGIAVIDCGWGGPRDCASDAEGNVTNSANGGYSVVGGALAFEFQPAALRQSYMTGVFVERSTAVTDWDQRGPGIRSFFEKTGITDLVALASVESDNGLVELTIHGPFTNDGSQFAEAIDALSTPAGDVPDIRQSLMDWIEHIAMIAESVSGTGSPDVLLLATSGIEVPELEEISAFAREQGVRVNTLGFANYGLPEIALRTGGFVAEINDARQFGIVFNAMDELMGRGIPFYHMEFRLHASPGTFVQGGNVKLHLRIHLPTALLPKFEVGITADVAMPRVAE